MKKSVKKEVEKPKVVKPKIIVETIKAEKHSTAPAFGKVEYMSKIPLPPEHVRCIVLVDYKGMTDDLYIGDILDLPERRFKTLSLRGFVKEYTGTSQPNKDR
jgi:hypothetical protein